MSIAGSVSELLTLRDEIKIRSKELANLRKRVTELESSVTEYLEHRDEPGFKYLNKEIRLREMTIHRRKKKDEKTEDMIQVLKSNGVSNPEDVLDDLLRSGKGSPDYVKKLKIEEPKKKKR